MHHLVRATASIAAGVCASLALTAPAEAACSTTRVTSLGALASQVGAGHSVCLGNGSYTGSVDLSNPSASRVVVSQEGAAVVHGQVRLNSSHLRLDGFALDNTAGTGSGADCVRIQAVGGTDIGIVNSSIGGCARDAFRMSYILGRHDNAVVIQGDTLHDAVWNACTCYLRGGLFADNRVQNISNDALELWGDSNVVRHNTFSNLIPSPATNHNDVLQTWQIPSDPATGDPLTNLVFEDNVIDTVTGHDAHGLMIQGGKANNGLAIRSNLFRDIGSIGMLLDGAGNVSISTNTFVRAGGMDTVEWKAGATGTLDSNIFYQAASAGTQPWYQDASSNPSHLYNLAWGGKLLANEPTGVNADPQFYDPNGTRDTDRLDDFSLGNASSPAVDHGNPSITSRIDLLGRPIYNSRVDDGAFEFPGS
jgi:adhesin HecA-like repeat protein